MAAHTNNVHFRVKGAYDLEHVESNDSKFSSCPNWEGREENKSKHESWDMRCPNGQSRRKREEKIKWQN